ncbi:MAG: hypothetical protein QOE71_368 [Pseudonocardiales bacterium]|jgi:hypothetical protein|nr:hypothetical protein [Pseudonocardiales bacterium]
MSFGRGKQHATTTFGNVKADVLKQFVPGYQRGDFVDIVDNSGWPE